MRHKFVRKLGLAAVILAASVGLGLAQTSVSPRELKGLLKSTPASPGAPHTGSGKRAQNGKTPAAIVQGWNYGHCYAGIWWWPGGSTVYIFAFNTEGTYVYYGINSTTTSAAAQNTLLSACQSGHLYAWYVDNTSTGAYEEIQVGF